MQFDPTRTTSLRNAFSTEMNKRFRRVRGLIRTAIVAQDVFRLVQPQVNITPLPGQFAFPTTQAKTDAFMNWLNTEINSNILEIRHFEQLGVPLNARWTDRYILDSYTRGVQRARGEMHKAGYQVPTIAQSGGIEAVMGLQMHIDRVGVLYSRAFNELKGVTAWMDQTISKVLAEGLIDGDGPNLLARKLNRLISGRGDDLGIRDSIGRYIPAERRARTIARTEIIRAHHQGMVQEYKNWKLAGVTVQAEWSTAGDNRVCQECADLQGSIFTLEEIGPMIPLHPNCRCIALPAKPKVENTTVRRTT